MAGNRKLGNGELEEDIIFTVSPYAADGDRRDTTSGAIGINQPSPAYGTFQVDSPSVNKLSKYWDTNRFRNYNSATDNLNSYGECQFYREGSRVYMDGIMQMVPNAGGWRMSSTAFGTHPCAVLPEGYRPIKTETFITQARLNRNGLDDYFMMAWVYINSSGIITLQAVGSNQFTEEGNPTDAPTGVVQNGQYYLYGWLSFGGINFRVSGTY